MRFAVGLALLFAARFAASALDYQTKDADVAWQRWLGDRILTAHALPSSLGTETFTAAGAAWTPQEWLFSLATAFATSHGLFAALAIAVAILAGAAIALTGVRARMLGASTLATFAVTLCTGVAMLQSFGVRAQAGGWCFLALFLVLLEVDGAWALAGVAVAVVWANVHASVVLAPVVAGLWTLGALADRDEERTLRGTVVTAGAAIATCCSPLGYHLPVYAVQLMQSPLRHAIVEWRASGIGDVAFAAGVLPLLLATCAFGLRGGRLPWRHLGLWMLGVLMGLAAVRNLPIAAILMAPGAALLATPYLPDRWRLVALLREPVVRDTATAAIFVAAFFLAVHARDALAAPRLPDGAIAAAAHLGGERRLYCEDFAWCSLALAYPNVRTFIDGRCDPFPAAVWRDYLAIEHVEPGWRDAVERYRIDTIVARRNGPLALALGTSAGAWHDVWRDDRYTVFRR